MGAEHPIRIDWFDNEIDSLRRFDPETQRSIDKISNLTMLPAKEVPNTPEGIQRFRQRWRERFDTDPFRNPIYQDISNGLVPAGIEYYLPLFFSETSSFFEYLPESALIVRTNHISEHYNRLQTDFRSRHESLGFDIERPILTPEEICLKEDEFFHHLKQFANIETNSEGQHSTFRPIPDVQVDSKAEAPFTKLKNFITQSDIPILLVAETAGRREALLEMLKKQAIKPALFDHWQDFASSPAALAITTGHLERGFIVDSQLALVGESQILGEKVTQHRRRKTSDINEDAIIRNLTELRLNAPVVHIDHGVGRYLGLTNLSIDGQETELLTIGYANEAKLYVP
ncbi:predicted protein, partial [Nematostella vectensis]